MTSSAYGQIEAGGVSSDAFPRGTTWYAGEGLKQGDFFSYKTCFVDYKECATFEFDFWIKGDKIVGSETKWLAEVVVYDGNKVIVGEMELGKIAPEPTGGTPELGVYRGAFKSSIAWLSAFATSDGSSGGKGPKGFDAASWGKIGNIGGQQIVPLEITTITVPAGTWETVAMSWKTGGAVSKVWIADNFPFPVKAKTYTHVSEGIPPPEYVFELLQYKQNVQQSPFIGIESTENDQINSGCDTDIEKEVSVKRSSKNFMYQIHALYGPNDVVQGCEMQWLINFLKYNDETEFLNLVQYDIFVVDDKGIRKRSIAQEEGRQFLYSPSGQAQIDFVVKEVPGTANYVIWVYGLAKTGIVPSGPSDYLQIEVPIYALDGSMPIEKIPSWIKNNAGWWAEGTIDDDSFVQGIQYLFKGGMLPVVITLQPESVSTEPEIIPEPEEPKAVPEPTPESNFDLQVIMGSEVYDLSDTATIDFSIDGISTPQNVALEISDPRGTSIISRSFEVDSQGVPFEFRIDENFKTGTYKVVATSSDNGNTITNTAYFKVKSQYNSFKITSVQVTDQQGNQSNLQAGEMGFIKVNLEANKSITTLVTVNLFDSDLTSIGIGLIKTTLSSGNSEIILSFMIPSDVAVGTSDIYVNAFSDWPSNGGIPLTGEISIAENIK